MLALGSALSATLSTVGSVPFFDTIGPQGGTIPNGSAVAYPYGVFQYQASVDEYAFGEGGISSDVAIKVISNRQWPGEAQRLYDLAVHPKIQDAALDMTGYTVLRCRRTTGIRYQDADGYWHVGGMYRIDAWEI